VFNKLEVYGPRERRRDFRLKISRQPLDEERLSEILDGLAGDDDRSREFLELVYRHYAAVTFTSHVPDPVTDASDGSERDALRVAAWGTQFDAIQPTFDPGSTTSGSPNQDTYAFWTAADPPVKWFEAVCAQDTDLLLVLTTMDNETGEHLGTFCNEPPDPQMFVLTADDDDDDDW